MEADSCLLLLCMLLTSPLPRSSLRLRCKGSVKELCLFAAISEPKMDGEKKKKDSLARLVQLPLVFFSTCHVYN